MSKERVIVTGINGFVGHHLTRELSSLDIAVIGIGQDEVIDPNIQGLVDEYHQADLTQNWPAIDNVKAVIHLAGLAAVGPSFDAPQKYINANSSMLTNLAEYYLKSNDKPRIIAVSSGAIYDAGQPNPINEDGVIGFNSPYAVSKVLNENQAAYYRKRGLDVIIARPFNHIGPGQNQGFILPDLYARLSNLNEGNSVVRVGNIETRRDYTDVRDIVRAYGKLALTESLRHTTYNICSGKSLSGGDIFTELKGALHLPDIQYEVDPSLVRPTDVPEIIGDSTLLQNELDWKPEYPIHQTIVDFVESKKSH